MSTAKATAPDEVIELEPTIEANLASDGDFGASRPGPAIVLQQGTIASFSSEMDSLRRKRMCAAALFLAVAFGILASWVFASDNPSTLTADGSRYSIRVGFLALRCLLAAVIAGLLRSEFPLTRKQLRVVENLLFLGLTLLAMGSLYFVGLDQLRRGPSFVPSTLAFIKDLMIQMLVLMLLYGMLIPNPPAVAARTLVFMFLGPIVALYCLRYHPEVRHLMTEVGTAEEASPNILFLGLGASLAFYGSYLLNGLRTELHTARKFGQYHLERKLAEGGMGEVYLAEHALLKRPCCLKLIKPDIATNTVALARFEREVQSAATLSHPNTIEIFD
jgi:serine/threonine-protein kinase